ncbi:multidrug ABC transporter ATP-binding protein [Pullulanibacillus camelliae]|uniref:Multidrug ABC transporter ATP-binding protein n=1 Tax=Pullulanibacillus camelliae TaxID=1707096 RepID=A0A8J2YGK8_9BACL|nr:ABC transporter ATP-binding protein [Pullulanibacillus camelliae]GGE39855.1 multidrug ABC transporter ATP-binding protein [Pullulanibacillus camelliae]
MNENYPRENLTRKHVLRRLLRYTAPHKKQLLFAFIILILATGADVLGPIVAKIFIDDFLTPRRFDGQPLTLLAVSFVCLYVFTALFHYLQLINFQKVALKIIQQLRVDVFNKVQHLGLSFFDKTPGGSLISRITNDTEAIKELFVTVLSTIVQSTVFLIGIFIGMFALNVKLAAYCLIILPVLFVLMYLYRRVSSVIFRVTREKLSQLNARLNESLQGMAIIQAMRQEKRLRKEFDHINTEHRDASLKNIKLNSLLLRPAVQLIYVLGIVLVLSYFGIQSFHLSVSIGVIFAFVNYLDRFFEPVNSMMQQLMNFQQATVSAERVFGLLDETELAPTQEGQSAHRISAGNIEFKNVSFSYDGKTEVLKNINFTARPGETVALVGHTGSGKSSIINLLMRFYPIEKGDILIDGKSLKTFSDQELRAKVGLVLQDPFIFAGDVKSNIRLNNASISDEAIKTSAQFVQADRFIAKLPKGYDEPIGERGSTFSSGQRQLLSFARTMAIDPKILVLDEATANVDTETEEAIQTALEKMRKGRTTIAIAHRLSTIQDADQILVLHHGEIVERGNHQELLSQKGLYHKMYLLQQGEAEVTA